MEPFAVLHNRHRGEACFVIGNGPSLSRMPVPLTGLSSHITITCSRGYLAFPIIGGPSTYWVVEDPLDVQQFGREFELMSTPPVKVVPTYLSFHAPAHRVEHRLNHPYSGCLPRFAYAPPFYWGGCVTYLMLQLAAYLGCAPVYMLGQDFKYSTANVDQVRDDTWRVRRDDNHFTDDYWPPGATAFPPNLRIMRDGFLSALYALRDRGVELVNLTPGTALDCVPTRDVREVLS